MRNSVLSYLLLPLFTAVSLSTYAAPPSELNPSPVVTTAQPVAKLDLNTADATTLQTTLIGIGKTKAEAIVSYREANGAFTSVDELLEIKGIGNALLERNRDKLTIH
ncbi:ComEA family DNA-binding protein [Pseudomonas tructae]|uniref:ComEA family DNA-binding protein n=1 Tax=Pseudomonas tructae TaxID=2518644 RepID=A0A411MQP5_9PSED|nr:ComEA family DNA-binding protein [Pseudomonas tructae]QBF29136.1 ComEA family DNA-binding protein [Pseudomonas tructae]